ncbi:MAG: prolipoprotein diacylglyceryl transferase [Proteobacteria bacterium]|nr:prolipoprotein diacylglyceryl transferase [Pseudomonadota bacterium]
MIPTLFHLGPIPIHSFGLMMVCSFLTAWKLLYMRLENAGENPLMAERLITWAAFGGILGARIGYLISFPSELMARPIETIFGGAGFVFHWGFVGGFLACWILVKKEKGNFLKFADLSAPSLALGYAIGRIGCQLSGDGDYGKLSDLPWAIGYPLGVVPTPVGVAVHPTPIYETIICCIIAIILTNNKVSKLFNGYGKLFCFYLILVGLERFFVEILRIEPIVFSIFTQAQVMSMGLIAIGTVLMFMLPKAREV